MDSQTQVRQYLINIEQVLRDHALWQETLPDPAALDSTQPFCMDTLDPVEWLQWVLIPRMHALLDSQRALPGEFAVAPYYEMALDSSRCEREPLLAVLLELDAFFNPVPS
ncbi:YqcC family protein [Citrobacter sp. JGM124]|uniref:YqcC family protein n=1 Tax=Citrobacter sp. JGM124 TaxID=2799789 RepID=UPI001BA4CF43|nr:YqcC family protein [Citrobacter sp. JGM124]MBS0849473.1 YqcC family protein [Citrobacter sp. JGM124]